MANIGSGLGGAPYLSICRDAASRWPWHFSMIILVYTLPMKGGEPQSGNCVRAGMDGQ